MSRTLSKVLIICALVVLISLTIVGTTIAAYYSVENTIVVEAFVDGESAQDDSVSAKVEYRGKSDTKLNVKAGHLQSVDLSVSYSKEAYKFVGWFEGDSIDYQNAKNLGEVKYVTEKPESTINVKMDGSDHYVAVFTVTKYSVSEWKKDNVTVSPEGVKESYVYGEALPEMTQEHYSFKGWQVPETVEESEVATQPTFYKNATFNIEELTEVDGVYQVETLTCTTKDSFVEDEKRTIKYEGLKADASDVQYYDETFTLKTPEKTTDYDATAGYKYNWITEDGHEYEFGAKIENLPADLTLTLNKKAIQYTAKLDLTDSADLLKNPQADVVTFDVETTNFDGSFGKWMNLETKYSFWKITGLTSDETTYTPDGEGTSFKDFVTAFVAEHETETAEATLKLAVKKYFTKLEIGAITLRANTKDAPRIFSDKVVEENNKAVELDSNNVNMDESKYESSIGGVNFLNLSGKTLHSKTEDAVVNYNYMQVTVNGNPYVIEIKDIDLETTLYDFIEYVTKLANPTLNETLKIDSVALYFAVQG